MLTFFKNRVIFLLSLSSRSRQLDLLYNGANVTVIRLRSGLGRRWPLEPQPQRDIISTIGRPHFTDILELGY